MNEQIPNQEIPNYMKVTEKYKAGSLFKNVVERIKNNARLDGNPDAAVV